MSLRVSIVIVVVLALVMSLPARAIAQPPQFRLPDDRPELDRAALIAQGFAIVESEHLLLVTDLPEDDVKSLPSLADALFAELEAKLGKRAPAEDGREFQVTGFLIQAAERFEQAGLLPPKEFVLRHGCNVGYRFWLNSQTEDYYRRHLLLHEFTHCFMTQDVIAVKAADGPAQGR